MGGGASEHSPLAFRDNKRLALFGKKFKFLREYFECNRKHKFEILSCHCEAATGVSLDNRINSHSPKHVKNLFAYSPIHLLTSKRPAFTLAEVLITLGIVGIVAAMTLPALVGNYQKKQTAMQLKKVYTILQQTTQRAEADFESLEYWNFNTSPIAFSNLYIKPYYKIIQDYDNTTFPADYKIFCNSSNTKDCMGYGAFRNSSRFIITDGTLLAFHSYITQNSEKGGVTIIIDINGFKKPNRYGRDVFMFTIQPKGGVLPYGVGQMAGDTTERTYDRHFLMAGEGWRACKIDGIFCAAVIMTDNWEIKDDYPWK